MTVVPDVQLSSVPGGRLIAPGRFSVAHLERSASSIVVLADSEDHKRIRLELPLELVLEATR